MSAKVADRAKIAEAAERCVKSGRLAEAVAEYQKLLDGTGQDVPIGNIIGDLCLQLGQEERALKLFQANVDALERCGAYSQALAIAKKIYKIRPSVPESIVRLGDLYGQLGFTTEARAEYARAAEELEKRKQIGPLIELYEKRVRIDRSDLATRLKLARLYLGESREEQALSELNDAADLLYVRNENDAAEKILLEALAIREGHPRTLANLARVYRALDRSEAATRLLERDLEKHGPRPDVLILLADLFLEKGEEDRAAPIYGQILVEDPRNSDVRAKLGQIEIHRGRLDQALEYFDPLVSGFLQKSDEDKAVGLLGLILMSGALHLPTLERLAGVFRTTGRIRDLEGALRLLLAEYRTNGRESDRLRILRELFPLASLDPEVIREAEALGVIEILRKDASEQGLGVRSVGTDEDREIIRMNLAKAELYVEQGLVRNARRILENLLVLYPEEPRVLKKHEELIHLRSEVEEEEIPEIVEQVGRKEAEILKPAAGTPPSKRPPGPKPVSPPPPKSPPPSPAPGPAAKPAAKPTAGPATSAAPKPPVRDSGPKVTAADLFAGLDLVLPTFPSDPTAIESGPVYLDVEDKIEEEIEALEAEFYKQLKERTSVIEKDLVEIVQDFRRQVDAKLDQHNYEARYNLGLAFMEQGLSDEAIAEFELAAGDAERTADCWGLIGRCYIQKRNFPEARRRFERAVASAPEDSSARYALAYELAGVCETLDDSEAALALYHEVQGWNPKYRNTAKRVKILEKALS
jgi:tetratricopeptide (TPR) repeat protein